MCFTLKVNLNLILAVTCIFADLKIEAVYTVLSVQFLHTLIFGRIFKIISFLHFMSSDKNLVASSKSSFAFAISIELFYIFFSLVLLP